MEKVKLSLFFRLLHWGVAFIVILNIFFLEDGKLLHRFLGYTALVFIIMRLIFHKKKQVTHYNDKAKYVYWVIWICIGGLGATGFLMELDRFFGNQTLNDIHENFSNILLALVFVHLSGIFIDAFLHKRKTWMVMITGEKR